MSKHVDSFKVQNILVKHSVEDCEDFPHKYEFTVDRCSIFYEKNTLLQNIAYRRNCI